MKQAVTSGKFKNVANVREAQNLGFECGFGHATRLVKLEHNLAGHGQPLGMKPGHNQHNQMNSVESKAVLAAYE